MIIRKFISESYNKKNLRKIFINLRNGNEVNLDINNCTYAGLTDVLEQVLRKYYLLPIASINEEVKEEYNMTWKINHVTFINGKEIILTLGYSKQ